LISLKTLSNIFSICFFAASIHSLVFSFAIFKSHIITAQRGDKLTCAAICISLNLLRFNHPYLERSASFRIPLAHTNGIKLMIHKLAVNLQFLSIFASAANPIHGFQLIIHTITPVLIHSLDNPGKFQEAHTPTLGPTSIQAP
jgi:hypothetical protein